MNDTSPRQHMSTKSAKTLKQKRTEKRQQAVQDRQLFTRKPPRPRGGGSAAEGHSPMSRIPLSHGRA